MTTRIRENTKNLTTLQEYKVTRHCEPHVKVSVDSVQIWGKQTSPASKLSLQVILVIVRECVAQFSI